MAKLVHEPNLLHHYFDPTSAIYTIIEEMRQGCLHNECRRFEVGLVNRAKKEVQIKNESLDASTYPFAQDLYHHLHGNKKGRVVMAVEGTFYGNNDIKSAIPVDLTKELYLLFGKARQVPTTIDDAVTLQKTGEFIDAHRGYLSQEGFNEFEIERSKFFYFRELDLEHFLDDEGKLDLKRLLPLIIPTNYVVLDQVAKPSLEEYMRLAPTHVSYRLKKSIVRKLLNKLCSSKGSITIGGDYGNKKRDVLVDWVAHRPVLPNLDDVNNLETFLRGSPKIGNSKVEYMYTKDYYEHPGGSGGGTEFKSKTVVAQVTTKGFEPCVREIQIVDKKTYYGNEFTEGKESHPELEKKRKHAPRKIKTVREHYVKILEEIFVTGKDIIHI